VDSQSLSYTGRTPFPRHRRPNGTVLSRPHIALLLSLSLGLFESALRLALKLSSLALCLTSKLVRLAGSLARDLVGLALRLSGAEASGLLDLLCHLADLLDALDGGADDALLGLSGGLRWKVLARELEC
jgi:hypothetical protein